jgi:hypothetical protein
VSEFNWWLLIVGLVVGAGLVWLVLADSGRREADVEAHELPAEAAWIADAMADQGRPIDQSDAEEVLRLHRTYLAGPPPDDEPDAATATTEEGAANGRAADGGVADGGVAQAPPGDDASGTTPTWSATPPRPSRR